MLYNHHFCLIPKHCHHSKTKPHAFQAVILHPLSPYFSATSNLLSVCLDLPIWTFHMNEITYDLLCRPTFT